MTTDALPRLETDRLILRERRLSDLDDLLAMNADPEVTRFIFDGGQPDPDIQRQDIRQGILEGFPPGLGYWSVFAKDDRARFLGWACLVPLPGHPEIEIGYRLIRAAWGRGYATETARACIAHGFGTVGLAEIAAVVHPANLASRRVLARLGLAPQGQRKAYGRDLSFYRLASPKTPSSRR